MSDCKALSYSLFARNERASPGNCNMRNALPDTLCAVAIAAALFWFLCAGLGVITQ